MARNDRPSPSLPAAAAELIAESASTALGGVAAGNLGAYLPLLLQHVHSQAQNPKQLYQLLKVREPHVAGARAACSLALHRMQLGPPHSTPLLHSTSRRPGVPPAVPCCPPARR